MSSKQPFWDRPGVLADRAVVQATLSSSFQQAAVKASDRNQPLS